MGNLLKELAEAAENLIREAAQEAEEITRESAKFILGSNNNETDLSDYDVKLTPKK